MEKNLNNKKRKIAVLHPSFGWGGAEALCVWVVYALKDEFDIDLIVTTEENVNTLKINKFFGTNFRENDFSIIRLKYPVSGYILNSHLIQRYFKFNSKKYYFVISTNNEMDFGKKGIQYIHYPVLNIAKEETNIVKKLYNNFSSCLSGYKEEKMKENFTITNSYWTKKKIKEAYGIECEVVYPSTVSKFPFVEWEEKEEGFICLGRIAPEKNLDIIINILSEVRKEFPDIHLHIIGHVQNRNYFLKIKKMIKKRSSWIYFSGDLTREEINKYLINHKYGIHGMKNEHFGIVLVEMIQAGSIIFIPNGGGQIEIVNNKRLIYSNEIDAVRKIKNVLRNNTLQKTLLFELRQRRKIFSRDRFVKQIKQLINKYLNKLYHNN